MEQEQHSQSGRVNKYRRDGSAPVGAHADDLARRMVGVSVPGQSHIGGVFPNRLLQLDMIRPQSGHVNLLVECSR